MAAFPVSQLYQDSLLRPLHSVHRQHLHRESCHIPFTVIKVVNQILQRHPYPSTCLRSRPVLPSPWSLASPSSSRPARPGTHAACRTAPHSMYQPSSTLARAVSDFVSASAPRPRGRLLLIPSTPSRPTATRPLLTRHRLPGFSLLLQHGVIVA